MLDGSSRPSRRSRLAAGNCTELRLWSESGVSGRYWSGPDTFHLRPIERSLPSSTVTWRSTRPVRCRRSSEGCPPKRGNPCTLTSKDVAPSGEDTVRVAPFSSRSVGASPASNRNLRNQPPCGASMESSTRKVALWFFAASSISTRWRDFRPRPGTSGSETSRNPRSVEAGCEASQPAKVEGARKEIVE